MREVEEERRRKVIGDGREGIGGEGRNDIEREKKETKEGKMVKKREVVRVCVSEVRM